MREYENPITTNDEGPMGGTTSTHPAFAQIQASRVQGQTFLYGSGFVHNGYISVTISRSQLKRSLSRDWFFGRNELIEVAMSEAQWASFISSMNMGSGVPCTISHIDRHQVPQLPNPPKETGQFDNELKERLGIVEDALKKLGEQINTMPVSEKKKKELLDSLGSAMRNLTPNLKFVSDQFGEHMEDTIEKAKIEVEEIGRAHV